MPKRNSANPKITVPLGRVWPTRFRVLKSVCVSCKGTVPDSIKINKSTWTQRIPKGHSMEKHSNHHWFSIFGINQGKNFQLVVLGGGKNHSDGLSLLFLCQTCQFSSHCFKMVVSDRVKTNQPTNQPTTTKKKNTFKATGTENS